MIKIIPILVLVFFMAGCTPQADLSINEDDDEILGVEAAAQPPEIQEEPVEPEEIVIEEEPVEIKIEPTEPVPIPAQEPEPTPPPKKTYVAPPEPEPEPIVVESEPSCHPSYSGCLNPNASDYDCAGGSGNGPYYTGTVRVIGPDVFRLDRDKDGWGCE